MDPTLCILGIDAADYALIKRWRCNNLQLSNYNQLDTFSHGIDLPATLEVWPTIATGVSPDEHGVHLRAEDRSGWGKSAAIQANKFLPDSMQTRIRELYQRVRDPQLPQTLHSHAFHSGSIKNWPGMTPCLEWEAERGWFQEVNSGSMNGEEFIRQALGNAGSGIGWLAGQHTAGVPVAGVHIHILDHVGHLYADKPNKLRSVYDAVDGLVGWLKERVDKLLIVSDHGMQTTETEDKKPGVHSWRAMISSTESGDLPESVFDVREWIEQHTVSTKLRSNSQTDVAAPRDHLEDLGYL